MNKMMKKIISVAIMLVFSAGVVVTGMRFRPEPQPQPKPQEQEQVKVEPPVLAETFDLAGMGAEQYEVTSAGKDADGNYVVFAQGYGYNESTPIEVAVTFDSSKNIVKAVVLAQAETNGLGTKIAEQDFLSKFEGVSAPVSVGGSTPKNPGAPKAEESAPVETAPAAYTDGTYTVEAAEFHNGYKDVVTVVIEGGKIVSVDYNCLTEDGGTKRAQSENGEYVMTEEGPLWHEQADAFAQYVVENQGTAGLNLADNGKTDVIAGVSIAISGAEALVKEALTQASASAPALVDGTYTVEAAEFHNGYKDVVTVVVEGGKIVSVDYNCLTEAGGTKRAESENGEYVMTEDGPLWHEQADAFAQYVVENQGTAGLNLADNGKTDVIAGVSIAISGAETLVNEAIAQATASTLNLTDGTYTAEAAEFHNGYKDIVTVVVEGGKIVSVDYNCLTEAGGTKRAESENGEYVMTEDGPLWHEQADALAQYVVENQGTAGLNLGDNGKTDVIAGVSIAISGAETLINDCIAQASGSTDSAVEEVPVEKEEPTYEATKVDAVSNATVSSQAFAKIVNNAFFFLEDHIWE